jgi:uncharacterized membrane protein YeaQ/YmgE (transglycosylase-associated protein family)
MFARARNATVRTSVRTLPIVSANTRCAVPITICWRNHMGILGWIILGGIAGWIAKIATGVGSERGCLFNIAVGIVGSVVGGLLFSWLGERSITGFNIWSLFVATVGAVVFLWLARMLGGGKGK